MDPVCNKRTLKKRIRSVISLCIFFTVFLFGGIIMLLTANLFKTQAIFLSNYFSSSVSQTMNSVYFLRQFEIKGLEEFDPDTPKARDWFDNLEKSEDYSFLKTEASNDANKETVIGKTIENHVTSDHLPADVSQFFNMKNLIATRIELDNKTIYSNEYSKYSFFDVPITVSAENNSKKPFSWLILRLFDYYSDTEAVYPLYNSKGEEIGRVVSGINTEFLIVTFLTIAIAIIVAGFFCLFAANIIAKLFTISITSPLIKLEEKIKAISVEDYEKSINHQIVLKRPLKEIESIAGSTNQIMQKMKEYNNLLSVQKQALENQNEELEAQNEELIESKRQIEETQTLLVQSENMASIGQLTAAITHEINTPLGAINSNVQICEMFMNMLVENDLIKSDEELSNLIKQMKEANGISIMACKRITEIIKSLKSFSKVDQAEFQEADINEGIRSVLILTSNLWKRRITIHEEYTSLPMVKCFPGMLNQVFMNIVVNAIQAIEDNGDIFIKTFSDEKYVYVSIRDTGSGIKEEHLQRIFNMGFTTKGSGVGMGIGLSICQNVIKKHNGELRVNSEIGKGTEFTVCIPL